MGLYSGGLIIGRIFASEIWPGAYFRKGLFFFLGGGGAYYRNFTVFLFICISAVHIISFCVFVILIAYNSCAGSVSRRAKKTNRGLSRSQHAVARRFLNRCFPRLKTNVTPVYGGVNFTPVAPTTK